MQVVLLIILTTTFTITSQLVLKNAADARAWVKRTNMNPPQIARFDDALVSMNRRNDAAWIFSGGFNQ